MGLTRISRGKSLMNRLARRSALGLMLTCAAGVAMADSAPQSLPFTQDWSNAGLITTSDDWSGVPGVVGYRGDDITSVTGADPRTLLGEGTVTVDVNAQALITSTAGGVLEVESANTIAMQGSGTADAPNLVVNLNTTGHSDINVSYVLRDLDTTTDDAQQQFALQYRIGASGDFTDVADGYVADATSPGTTPRDTPVAALLPPDANNQPLVQVRIITSNAAGNDELVGIDDISITSGVVSSTPALSISNTSAAEGDSGTTPFMFTVSLNRPAGNGGVAISYSTVDGTAIAGSDYVAIAGGSTTIPEGQSSVTISVEVVGDTVTEPAENFFVDITAATGATITDGQGTGTINNDDVTVTQIHDIQGPGNFSPISGHSITTRGIVTGRKSNGFFLQAADAEADADPATSEGVFVFTGAAPPADAQIGNELLVTGTVVEFLPAADTGQLSLTEITGPSITLLGSGNALPAPVQLTTTFPDPMGPLDQLERVEGMRVTAASFTVVAATAGNTNETNATGSSNGQLNLVVTGTPRPFREPGIQAPDAPPAGTIPPIPRWDFNPELLFSDTDALGGPRHDLAVGATLQNYVGPLDYGFRRFSVHQDPTNTPTVTAGPAPTAARIPTPGEFTYASYNLERFFDTADDPTISEPVLTSTAFANRLAKASLGMRDFLHLPDIIGVVEVENLSTLAMLSTRLSTDAMAAGFPNPRYTAHLLEGNDVGGIDVGFLVKTGEVTSGTPRVEVLNVAQLGKDTTWNDPVNGPGTLLNDRPPLMMDAVVHYADGSSFPITVIQVHQRSLNGADTSDAGGDRTRTKRHLQAVFLAEQINSMQLAEPQRRIAVGGDFNAFEFNDGLVDAMGTITGLPSADDATAVTGDGADYVVTDLLNLYVEEPADQRYSFEFDGNAQSLDHVLVNQALGGSASAIGLDHARINADFPEILRGDTGTVARLADHDPAMAYIDVASADLGVSAAASPPAVMVGSTFTIQVTISNTGPDTAQFPGVGFALDAELPDLTVQPPTGWTCTTPTVGTGETVVSCSAASMANGGSAAFTLQAAAPASEAGNTIRAVAVVESATFDPNGANDAANAQLAVTALADMGVSISGPGSAARGSRLSYTIPVSNGGGVAAVRPVLVVELNTSRLATRISAPNGWRCTATARSGNMGFHCRANNDLPAGASAVFSVDAPGQAIPADSVVNVSAGVTTTSQEQTLSNNTATLSTQLSPP